MPAVDCSCTFDKRYFRCVAVSQQLRDDPQRRVGVQQKMNPGADKNKSLNHQKPGAPKGLPIFALAGRLCGGNVLGSLFLIGKL